MKVVIASDSFKGSAKSMQVANAIENGILKADSKIEVVKFAIADGGEGVMDALVINKEDKYQEVEVLDPLGRKIISKYGILSDNKVIIEMAAASGLTLLKTNEFAPLKTTTFGVGELINHALSCGHKDIYIGLGGSATNDGGVGMAMALGVLFLDKDNKQIGLGNISLKDIHKIAISGINPLVKEANFTILSDVNNPLLGELGAANVFGPQKGASLKDIKIIENNLKHLSDKLIENLNKDVKDIPGAGAAGGLGAGLIAFCQAEIGSGVDKLLEIIDIESELIDANLVITGEGRIDGQTIYGKAPIGVAKIAKRHDLFVLAIVGSVGDNAELVYDFGIDMILDIINEQMSLEAALKNVDLLVEKAAYNFMRTWIKINNKHLYIFK